MRTSITVDCSSPKARILITLEFHDAHASTTMAVGSGDCEFFVSLGERIAMCRKTNNITQAQLTKALGVPQQKVQANEHTTRTKRRPASKWQQQIEAVARLPKAQQRVVSQMLDTALSEAQT